LEVAQRIDALRGKGLDPFELRILELLEQPVVLTPVELGYLEGMERRIGGWGRYSGGVAARTTFSQIICDDSRYNATNSSFWLYSTKLSGGYEMSDISGIIGTLSGFTVAFIADPIKKSIQNLIDVRLLRKAIYCELLSIYDRSVSYLRHKESLYSELDVSHFKTISDVLELFVQLDKKAFLYAKEQQPLLFYRLDEAVLISIVFSEIDYYQRLEKEHTQELNDMELVITKYATLFKESFERLFTHKSFDKNLLFKLSKGLRCQDSLRLLFSIAKSKPWCSSLKIYLKKYTRCIPRRCALTFFSDPNNFSTIWSMDTGRLSLYDNSPILAPSG
jgi:hypothetical protein